MPNTTANRSRRSIVRGFRIKDINSGNFSSRVLPWNNTDEEDLVLEHIRLHPNEDEKYDDLDDLLEKLDLDGFESVRTADGKNLGDLIRRNVQGKIRGMRLKFPTGRRYSGARNESEEMFSGPPSHASGDDIEDTPRLPQSGELETNNGTANNRSQTGANNPFPPPPLESDTDNTFSDSSLFSDSDNENSA
ncbi:hypothetical protein HD806DRAFT_477908 [Xylariaceae sp. AK1471]|nr:hypothetical protein HD806DRAFT_477908 [Xylariaceae sp. AK1471]